MTEAPGVTSTGGHGRSRFTPAERARAALGVALGVVSPEAVALDDGRVRLSNSGELLELSAVERLDTRLEAMAGREDVTDQRLLVEAVAALGAEVDHSRGGSSPVDGATIALDQLLDLPDAAEDVQDEARTVLRNVLESNQLSTETAVRRLAAERAAERAPLVADTGRASRAIQREAELLGRPSTPPAIVRRRTETGRHRRQVGARHRKAAVPRTVGTPAAAGLTATGRPKSESKLTPAEALEALRLVKPTDLPGEITTPNDVTSRNLGLVTTAEHGAQYFRVVDEEPPGRLVAHTTVRAGSLADPHQVRIAGGVKAEQLPRIWASQIGGTLREVSAKAPTSLIDKVRARFPRFQGRQRQATAQYDQFRLVSRNWREEQLQPTPDPAKLTQLRGELEQLAKAIGRTGQPAPALPDSARALHVVPQTQTAQAPAQPNTPAHLREQVVQEMAGLEKAAKGLDSRAEFRRTTAEAATTAAADSVTKAKVEEGRNDSAGSVRGRKLRDAAQSSTRKAERHLTIAATCDDAATKAREAGQAYGVLLTKLEELEASGGKPGPEIQQLAQAATEKVSAYRTAAAATLPSPDVQHTAITSGRFPHLTKLTRELNQELARRQSTFRYTPEVLHRRLRSGTRRVLSPNGVLLTVGNNPRADAGSVIQFKVKLNPGELREVLSSPLTFDEGALAQLRQGGFSVATTTVESLGYNGGANLKTLTAAFPDSSALKGVSHIIAPGFEHAVGQSHSVTGSAQENGLSGAVEVLNGEILRYAADAPEWRWQVRGGVGEPWSQANVVDSGDPQDASQLVMGISHSYTVPPPKETVRLDDLEFDPDVDPATELERAQELPEHVASRVDGMDDLADKGIAGLRTRLGKLDRTAADQVRAMCVDDAPAALTEATRPGGFGRIIYNGGRAVAYAQLETTVVRESAELLSDSSPEHKIERIRVGFSGASGSQSFGTSSSTAATLEYGGKALSDLGTGTVDFGPTLRGARSVSRGDSLSVSDVAIHPSVQRTEETIGVKVRLEHKLTFHRLDKDEAFDVENAGDAVLRLPENEAADNDLPFPKAALVLDKDGKAQLSADGGVLTRGCAQPGEPMKLPVWMGNDQGQLRGAGAALVQKLRGADPAYKAFVRHLSDEGMVPKLDRNFQPILRGVDLQDPVVVSQLANLERVGQQLSRHRLETGYDQACQGGFVFALTQHRVRDTPQERTYRVAMTQDLENPRWLGLNRSQTAANLHIGSNTTSRSRNRSKGLPWSAKLGFSDRPGENQAGSTPSGGPSYGRSAMGRFFSWVTGTTVNGVTLTESSGPLADFRIKHTLTVTEVLPDGDTPPIVELEGSAKLSIDSEFCDRGEPQCVAIDGEVDPQLLQTATWQHLDAGDISARLTAALPAVARSDSAALHHLAGFVNVRNLNAHPEMLTTEYRTDFAVSPAPSDALQALAQRGLTPRRGSITLTTKIENLRYVGSGHPIIGDINLTLDSAGFTTGSSTGNTAGIGGGTGMTEATGDGWNGSVGVNRSGNISSSSNELAIRGVERLNIKDGQHYQFVGDLKLEAKIKAAGLAAPEKVELDTGTVMLTIPERDALKMYGDSDLDLPLEKVADAVERMQDGNLSLDRRTSTAMIRRYQRDKQGVTTGLAATHTDEKLKALLPRTAKITKPRAQPETFDQVAADAEKVAKTRAEAQLPNHYRTTMGAGLVDRDVFRDGEGNVTTMEREVSAAVAEAVPDAAGDPAVGAAIRSQLAGIRWRGHAEKVKDPTGFNLELPFGGEEPGTSAARNLRIRVRMVRTGPITIDEAPSEGKPPQPAAAGEGAAAEPEQTENALIILQGYDYTEEGRGITRSVGYGADLGAGLTDGDAGSAGLSTELTTSESVNVVDQNTHLSRALWSKTKRVEHDFRLVIEVEETPGAGAETKGKLRQTADRFRSDEKRPAPHRREASGRLTLLVPASDVNQVPLKPPEYTDHRPVVLSTQKFLRGIQLHDQNGELPNEQETIDDPDFDDALVSRVTSELGGRRWLTRAGVQLHKGIIREELNGSARRIAFERSDGTGSPWTPGLPVPGHGSRQVRLRLRADLSGLQLVSDSSEHAQVGEAHRHQVAVNTSQESTRLAPTSQNIGTSDPTTGLKAGASFGEQAKERSGDTSGNRDETNSNESGELVTVQLLVTFHVDARRQRTTRDHQTKVTHEATFENAATGVVTLSMFRHDFEAMQARMEAGQAPMQHWNPDELAKLAKRVPVRRVAASEVVTGADGSKTVAPYKPLVDALDRARKEQVEVVVTMKQQDGAQQVYRALPNGTMVGTSKDDNGYGAAFGALHPSLAMLAEGNKIDLRKLYDAKGAGERFSGTVVQALEEKGVAASALTGLDHTRSGPHNAPEEAQGAKAHAARHVAMARGKRGSGMGVQ
ncbi:hypothetical protein [Kribbella italica]|uniref:Uncharacterized protein n=1 Tax=Kribbella italica TaxID=1540520 RepID=A0A7W9J4Q2_9ACTN|nr:hypothetical protein [Kribbella italica]MBB5835075.1 hypothetical protein [Kribbella italica]